MKLDVMVVGGRELGASRIVRGLVATLCGAESGWTVLLDGMMMDL